MNDMSDEYDRPIAATRSLLPTPEKATMSVSAAIAWLWVKHQASQGIYYDAGDELMIGGIAALAGGYLHEFLMAIIDRIRRS